MAIRIAVVQAPDGHLTCVGPNDFKADDWNSQMDAALGWHIEAGHLPAAAYWIEVDIPPLPATPVIAANAVIPAPLPDPA